MKTIRPKKNLVKTDMTKNKTIYLWCLLGLLSALAPVINNMISPALPAIASAINAGDGLVQLGLTASLVGFAVGQIVVGPMSDRLGRRVPLLTSMTVLVLVSGALAFVTSLPAFVALRLLQGVAAGGGIVIARSVATDLSSGNELMKMLAAINVINGLAPIVTPIAGGFITSCMGWPSIFWAMLAVSAVLAVCCVPLRESLPIERRSAHALHHTLALFADVMRQRAVVMAMLHQGGALAILFGNIAATPFLAAHYGLHPSATGVALGVVGIFTAIGAGLAPMLGNAARGIRVAAWGILVGVLIQAVVLWYDYGFVTYQVVQCFVMTFVGVTLTSSSTHVMDCARKQAGTASALLGAVGFLMGAVAAPLVTAGNIIVGTAMVYLGATVLVMLGAAFISVDKPRLTA